MDLDGLLVPHGAADAGKAKPVWLCAKNTVEEVLAKLPDHHRAWARAQRFEGQRERLVLLPDGTGEPAGALFGLGAAADEADPFLPGRLARLLPEGVYRLDGAVRSPRLAALAWLLEAYRFDRYKSRPGHVMPRLVLPEEVDGDAVRAEADAVALARDLINTPASDMGPDELEAATRELARRFKASVKTVYEAQLLKRNFPMIHAVGRASTRGPRLIDMIWGPAGAPRVTLVGKGVCFDTGGLNIKPGNAMSLMKKDMGGAANVLGLASMIMAAELPVRLRVLIPAVENAISGDAFRPGDVLSSRKGLTVEIGNTDAEGRLVLADALALADAEEPDLLIDMATLTGAARVALGPDIAPFFTSDDALAIALSEHAVAENDPLWRLPLWPDYDRWLDSKVADVNHIADSSFAGCLTAALFLKRFVEKAKAYLHLDIYAWTPKARPGHPVGGEAQGIRALFALIRDRHGG